MLKIRERLAAAQGLAESRREEIDKLLGEVRTLKACLDEEHRNRNKEVVEHAVLIEKCVNLEAKCEALMLALVAAYKTRKP